MIWPNVRIPRLEQYAGNLRSLAGAELVAIAAVVLPEEVPSYLEFVGSNYLDWIEEAHMINYGNLDLVKQPEPYIPFLYEVSPTEGIVPAPERDYFLPTMFSSPPGIFSGITNADSYREYGQVFEALNFSLSGETVLNEHSAPKQDPQWLKYHKHSHSQLPGSKASHPHYQMLRLIKEVPQDPDSRTVGLALSFMAWDKSLRNLLPSNVRGIHAVVRSNCGQAFTYQIDGNDAFYLGDGDQHDPKYDTYQVEIDMAPHTHPEFLTTPGHCIHKMVSQPSRNQSCPLSKLTSSSLSPRLRQKVYLSNKHI